MTSVKRRSLATEPLEDNVSVVELPGVGPILGAKLIEAGFDTAIKMRTKVIELGNNLELFQSWMHSVCNANVRQSAECFYGLNDSCEAFMREDR